jgi:mono/diheme cytochrome c family protein
MLRNCTRLMILSAILISCNANKTSFPAFLSKDSLPSQMITVDNSRDTSIVTANGAIIKIEKGSFSANDVKLEVKEAYSVEQMILAGLVTESDGKPLSSGGMIYVNSVDKNVSINKPLNISIPTNYYDNKMQLYKGEEKDGKINWVDPQPLPTEDSLPPYLEAGKTLFRQNCASCHSLNRDLTGPSLSATEGRGPWGDRKKLFEWTRNPARFMARDCYTQRLKQKFGAMMTGFPQLDDQSLNSLYDYIKNEDYQRGIVYSDNANGSCVDSCRRYDSLYAVVNNLETAMNRKRDSLKNNNGNRITVDRSFSDKAENRVDYDTLETVDTVNYIAEVEDTVDYVPKVSPITYQPVYYNFEIKTFDWYNIDHVIVPVEDQVELKVEMKGDHKDSMSLFIIEPAYRIFAEGGPLKGEQNVFGFYTEDGKISLATGTQVIVFAVGESDGQIFFDFRKFRSTEKQRITLEPKPVSKREFNRAVKKFHLEAAPIEVKDSKNSKEIEKTDKEMNPQLKKALDLLELYRPKNCDCNCRAPSDTTQIIERPALR